MAAVSATSLKFSCSLRPTNWADKTTGRFCSIKLVSKAMPKGFPSLRSSHFRVCCAAKPETAKPETVSKVMEIVKKQLALTDDKPLSPASTFSELGADSLDTVEIVMCLEEEFDINVAEDSSQNISTVQEAADVIEKLVAEKAGAA